MDKVKRILNITEWPDKEPDVFSHPYIKIFRKYPLIISFGPIECANNPYGGT
jgi:hypothetical protein